MTYMTKHLWAAVKVNESCSTINNPHKRTTPISDGVHDCFLLATLQATLIALFIDYQFPFSSTCAKLIHYCDIVSFILEIVNLKLTLTNLCLCWQRYLWSNKTELQRNYFYSPTVFLRVTALNFLVSKVLIHSLYILCRKLNQNLSKLLAFMVSLKVIVTKKIMLKYIQASERGGLGSWAVNNMDQVFISSVLHKSTPQVFANTQSIHNQEVALQEGRAIKLTSFNQQTSRSCGCLHDPVE